MKKKHKSALLVVLLVTIVIVIAVYFVQREQRQNISNCETCRLDSNINNQKTALEKVESSPEAETVTESDLKYQNTDYGFEIELTEVWQDSKIEEEDTAGAIKKIVFYFPTQDKAFESTEYFAPALSVYIYNKPDWEKISPNKRSSTEIITNDDYAFTYSIWETTPQDLEYITEKELADVIETFKLNN